VVLMPVRDLVAEIAAIVSLSPAQAGHYLRVLQKAGVIPFFGKGIHVAEPTAQLLIDPVLAFAAGLPIEGPTNVRLYRALRARNYTDPNLSVTEGYLERPAEVGGLTIHPSLGASLESFATTGATVQVDIFRRGNWPQARVAFTVGSPLRAAYGIMFDAAGQSHAPRPDLMVRKSATVTPAAFARMAEILRADSPYERRGRAQAGPRQKESAALPQAAPSDQHRSTDDAGGLAKPQGSYKETGIQAPLSSAARSGPRYHQEDSRGHKSGAIPSRAA